MVKVYDNVIPDNACKSLIHLFEYNKEHQEYINEDHCPCFTQININQISIFNFSPTGAGLYTL